MKCFIRDVKGFKHASFDWGGVSYTHSLRTKDSREAEIRIAPIRDTLYRMEQGTLLAPPDGDIKAFILSGGSQASRHEPTRRLSIGVMSSIYLETAQGIEDNTRLTKRIHLNHVKRLIGEDREVETIKLIDVQSYARDRLKEQCKGKPIQAYTVRKELVTFRQVWNWAASRGMLAVSPNWSLKSVEMPKDRGREPFRTYEQIGVIIGRGKLSAEGVERLWETLYLTSEEMKALLEYVKSKTTRDFVYPMVAFVALTGCRRSEMCRSLIEDWDLVRGIVTIREKKRDTSKQFTMREVDVHPALAEIMKHWFSVHPGGQHAITLGGNELDKDHATHHLRRVLGSHEKWTKIKGFHTLRHSVASILASKGVDQRYIDRILGHQTEAMRKRYQHLFPRGVRQAIELLV